MPILIVAAGVLILLFLIIKGKLNTFVSLLVVSFLVAIGLGMDINKIVLSIETGIGWQLGHLALVFGLGAMLGRLVSDAGGGYRIAVTLIDKFGKKRIQAAVVIASFIIGIALFFEVGLVLLIPIVYAIAKELKMPFLYLGIPMAAALNVTHGFATSSCANRHLSCIWRPYWPGAAFGNPHRCSDNRDCRAIIQ